MVQVLEDDGNDSNGGDDRCVWDGEDNGNVGDSKGDRDSGDDRDGGNGVGNEHYGVVEIIEMS